MNERDLSAVVQRVHEKNRIKYERTQRVITIARKRAGITQRELARRIYVATGTMACYESGKLKAPWDVLERELPELKHMRDIVVRLTAPLRRHAEVCANLGRKALHRERDGWMELRLRCDRCGKDVHRTEACALVFVQRAFSGREKGEREQFELCPACREALLRCVYKPEGEEQRA